jgi:predicted phage terminase large subunit-like protein
LQQNNEDFDLLEAAILAELRAKAQDDFYTFVLLIAPLQIPEGFKDGEHIRKICLELQEVEAKEHSRLMLFLPPRSMKSVLASILFPLWCIGRNPSWHLMSVSHSASLASDFGRAIRNLMMTQDFQLIFPWASLSPDSRAADKWMTTKKGVYNSAGAGTGLAGKGAHLGIADDLLSEQTALNPNERKRVKDWWGPGFRSRLMPGGRLVLINTRWHEDDIAGWLLQNEKKGGVDKWRVVNIPAIIDEDTPQERSYWPEWKSLEELKAIRDDPSLTTQMWNALYQGNPIPDEGVLMLREHFQKWPAATPLPKCSYVIMTADTAFTDKTANDPSCLQIWGIFNARHVDSRGKEHFLPNAILLANRVKHLNYPELLSEARELEKLYRPDRIIVENKASGQVLIPDLRASGLPVHPYTPGKGQDKTARVQAILRFLDQKRIHVPDEPFSARLIDEATAFPNGRHDDQVDAMTMALLFLRDAAALYTSDTTRGQEDAEPTPKPPIKTYWTRLTRPLH